MKKLLALIKGKGKSKKELTDGVKKALYDKELLTQDGKLKVESEIIFIPTWYPGMEKQWGSSPKKNNQPPHNNGKS